jgi:hypothetical protein
MTGQYILKGREPVEEPDLITWAEWMEDADRHVALSIQEGIRVSTVFLGLDHSFDDDAPPLLFETMVFMDEKDEDCERYSTWEEAEAGHARMVRQALSKRYQRVL